MSDAAGTGTRAPHTDTQTMETRKIQQVGGGTYTVSLPKEWATTAGLEPGATVALHTHIDGTLVVRTGTDHQEATAPLVLAVDGADQTCLERTLRAAYAAGIDTVELVAEDGFADSHHRMVARLTRNLTGVTVTESSAERVVVRSLLDAAEVSIPQSVRQLQFTALSAHREASAALSDPATVENPEARDDQADRIWAMVDRYFQQGLDSLAVMDALGLTRPALFVRWGTARELERVADHARRIAAVAGRLDAPLEDDLAERFEGLAERARTLVRDAVAVVVDDADTATVHRILDDCERLRTDCRELDRGLFESDTAPYRLTNAVDTLRRTADSADAIARLALRSLLRDRQSEESLAIGTPPAPSTADTES